jgi:hypothetical protein
MPRQQEGFGRALSVPAGEPPRCSSYFAAHDIVLADFRGGIGSVGIQNADGATQNSEGGNASIRAHGDLTYAEWETSPVEVEEDTVFTWIGASQVRPMRSMFPYIAATLDVDGKCKIKLPLGLHPSGYRMTGGGCTLSFEPRRHQSLVEISHRSLEPSGTAGFFRLEVPARYLTPGKPLRLRVDLPPAQSGFETFFFVSPRTDALKLELEILRDEVAQLQRDMVQMKATHEILYTQLYPQLFPKRIAGELVIACQDETKHFHPPSITVLRDGEVVITMREATDHLAIDGRIVIVRSRDGGKTYSPREVLFDLGNVDHRGSPIFELPNGDWVTTDYRAGGLYHDKIFDPVTNEIPTLWGARSTDRGKTWQFSEQAMTVPGAAYPYSEIERPMIQLPSGRLLVAGAFYAAGEEAKPLAQQELSIAVYFSDDEGRTWDVLGRLPACPHLHDEATMLQTKKGKIILLSRVPSHLGDDPLQHGGVLQSESSDEGKTWSPWRATGMSSMSTPAHLLRLQDGRILCTHASRGYPGEIYVTLSHDEGESWDTNNTRIVTNDLASWDSTYPTSGQLADGTLITTWYANLFGKFYIATLRYRPEQL